MTLRCFPFVEVYHCTICFFDCQGNIFGEILEESLHFCKFVCRIEKKVVSLPRFSGDDRMIIANKELLDEFVQQHANAEYDKIDSSTI